MLAVRRVKHTSKSSLSKQNRNSRETNVDDILGKPEIRKSRETNLDDIIAEQQLGGSISIDDLVPNHKTAGVTFEDIVEDSQAFISNKYYGL
ncbi:hypothetical protein DPMN_056551 [Dreissena polymorpha]|uniref:Uncharacterized protein n=1 Tax=Dreissena polymorpha TaxID=45954 RepID=A0A9D4CTG8_DREPO|nr:hypothetical protein DPMN_056551 [Dreissena polymorpha]